MLLLENITFAINRRIIFNNLSFDLKFGDLLKIVGSNGCGKTSLLKIISFLYKKSFGNIFWNGKLIKRLNVNKYINDIIFIGYKQNLNLLLTPYENLDFHLSLNSSTKLISINDAFFRMGILEYMNTKCIELSAGQLQRVILSRLIIQPSKIWILDEPFSHLDYYGVVLLNYIINNFLRSGGIVILTDHSNSLEKFINIKILNLMKYK